MTNTDKPLTSAELADLKAKAKAATPAPWEARRALTPEDGEYDYAIGAEIDGNLRVIAEIFGRVGTNTRVDASLTANFIAAANPETILRLIDMIERWDEQIEKLKTWARILWRLTKNMDFGELADYDDELASDVRELREQAHDVLFGKTFAATEPHDDAG